MLTKFRVIEITIDSNYLNFDIKAYQLIRKIVKYLLRSIFIPLEILFALVIMLLIYMMFASQISTPQVPDIHIAKRKKIGENHYVLGDNYLKKNEFGIWEMYLEGSPYERGLIYGELAKELIQKQEVIFVDQINQFVPKGVFQQLLKLMVGYFNSDLPKNIPLENQQEIYGISQSFSDEFDYIAPKYVRILNYHAAHDIGHALNDYSVVGCTSFAIKGEKSASNHLIAGRNFDFYVGDAFSEDQLILFVKPDKGFAFASYSWAGFTGVASGLNEKGLSVTINASKSDLPKGSKMPISLLAREILQYASTTKEAIAIAKKRKTFVSETLMITCAKENTAILIEKSPEKLGVFEMKQNELICSNHYQSNTFINDKINKINYQESDSKYRYNRVKELLKAKPVFDKRDVLQVLRDQKSSNGDTLGMGNPRAINQLQALHSVIILPTEKTLYISTHPFQLGEFIGYNLEKTFASKKATISDQLSQDPFLSSIKFDQFLTFKKTKQKITQYLMFGDKLTLTAEEINKFISTNSESYVTFELLGKYELKQNDKKEAAKYFRRALTKKVASIQIENELKQLINQCKI